MNLRNELDTLKMNAYLHIDAVADLAKVFSHTIKRIQSNTSLHTYTCLVYVLGFAGDTTYPSLVRKANNQQAFAGKDFFDWLVANQYLSELSQRGELIGDLVVYLDSDGQFKHIGILVEENRVKSKWGDQGLYEHELFEVPKSYGDDVKFYEAIKYDKALAAFKKYLAELV